MNNVIMSRKAAQAVLLNRHIIKALPFIDSQKETHLKPVRNTLRIIKRYPLAFDFIVNIIEEIKDNISDYVTEASDEYYSIEISNKVFERYLDICSDCVIRQSFQRQLLKEMTTGFVQVEVEGKSYIWEVVPFRIMSVKTYEDGTRYFKIFFLKELFSGLIMGSCFFKGSDGYIKIPAHLFPAITQAPKGFLQSHNPIYKSIIFGLMRNTHKKEKIEIDRNDFLQTIHPEYYRKDSQAGTLSRNVQPAYRSTSDALRTVSNTLSAHLLPNSYFLGDGCKKVHMFFNIPQKEQPK